VEEDKDDDNYGKSLGGRYLLTILFLAVGIFLYYGYVVKGGGKKGHNSDIVVNVVSSEFRKALKGIGPYSSEIKEMILPNEGVGFSYVIPFKFVSHALKSRYSDSYGNVIDGYGNLVRVKIKGFDVIVYHGGKDREPGTDDDYSAVVR
jgi:hypothetical protein